MDLIKSQDPAVYEAMNAEKERQESNIELIASENYASPLVMQVQNSVFTNKYAEGYPDKRYYAGCEFVDVAERLAIERLKAVFDCDYANVQPHAGAQAEESRRQRARGRPRHRRVHAGRPAAPWTGCRRHVPSQR